MSKTIHFCKKCYLEHGERDMVNGYGPIEIRWLECACAYEYVEYCPFCGASGEDLLIMDDSEFYDTRDKINGETEKEVETELYKWWKTLEFDEEDKPVKKGFTKVTAQCVDCGKTQTFTAPKCNDLAFICWDCAKKRGIIYLIPEEGGRQWKCLNTCKYRLLKR